MLEQAPMSDSGRLQERHAGRSVWAGRTDAPGRVVLQPHHQYHRGVPCLQPLAAWADGRWPCQSRVPVAGRSTKLEPCKHQWRRPVGL